MALLPIEWNIGFLWVTVGNLTAISKNLYDAFQFGTMVPDAERGQFSDGIKKNFTSKDFRFTTKGGYLYAAALKCSDNGEYCIISLGEQG